MDAFPVTVNGKVDRRRLPDRGVANTGRAYEAPVGPVEESLAELWQGLLRVARVGRDDNFFALGGHSLLAMQMVNELRTLLRVELPFRAVFVSLTLADLAARIDHRPRLPSHRGERARADRTVCRPPAGPGRAVPSHDRPSAARHRTIDAPAPTRTGLGRLRQAVQEDHG
jgi:hypothetical protein